MRARISITGNAVLCKCDDTGSDNDIRIPLTDEVLTRLKDWTQQYNSAVRSGDTSLLAGIGAAMFGWLDDSRWASRWVKGVGARELEIAVDDVGADTARAIVDMPWETLFREGDFLAADSIQPFIVFRSIGRGANAVHAQPDYRDLAVIFMAAAPEGERELNFETEEAAIRLATECLPLQLVVEESGCARFLKDRLAQDGPFEVVHVSCHGGILKDVGPILALETFEGDRAETTPEQFAEVLGERKPRLVFLSTCRTAETGKGNGADAIEPFARELIRAGVPNVLGWDGSVYDDDAIIFAESFYKELAEHHSVPFAAATARRNLLREHRNDPDKGHHWHLARVYAGPKGAGQCCNSALKKRQFCKDPGYEEFLDKANSRVPVPTARQFVGRRRKIQAVLWAFRKREKAGVLIFGMGNLGKSSVAARVANRMTKHETVVVYEDYDAPAIFDQLIAALPGRKRAEWEQRWREGIATKGAVLGDALEEMLEDPFNTRPILLIIDDLEQILETPEPGRTYTRVKDASGTPDAWRNSMIAVLRAFGRATTESRLLLTSRYVFSLPDGKGHDLADALARVQLHPMNDKEREKQWWAARRVAGHPVPEEDGLEYSLVKRAREVAGGNPGLQEILCQPILAGEMEAASKAVAAVDHWKTSGEVPQEENAAQEFFRRISFETYRNALTAAELTQLRAGTLFSEGLPVPIEAMKAVGLKSSLRDPGAAISRLVGLGLVDKWGKIDGVEHAAVNPLARPLAGDRLTDAEKQHLAAAAIIPLAAAWRDADGDFPFGERGVEAARLALMGDTPVEVLDSAAYAAGSFLFNSRHNARAALEVMIPALEQIEKKGGSPRPGFLLVASNCAERIGEIELQIDLLEKGLALQSDDKITLAQIAAQHAESTISRYGPEKALETLRNAVALFKQEGDVRSRAVTMGRIADILEQRGETDEALRIYKEEELPVYDRLGDVRSRAVTMGKIADILSQRGETDEALRIRKEEQLPVYERLGDVRSRAVTMGRIADILSQRGETDEALRIRKEEQLPVYERLGDVRSRAVTMGKIADILSQRGKTDEALRIRQEEQLPVYERLGDVRERAIALFKIADIQAQRGETDKALTALDQAAAAFEKLKMTDEAALVRKRQKKIRERNG